MQIDSTRASNFAEWDFQRCQNKNRDIKKRAVRNLLLRDLKFCAAVLQTELKQTKKILCRVNMQTVSEVSEEQMASNSSDPRTVLILLTRQVHRQQDSLKYRLSTVRSESRCALRLRYVQVQACIDARGHHFQLIL
jgi:hypothetical protein